MWSIGNVSQPNNLESLLESESFVKTEKSPGMALDLNTLDKSRVNIEGLIIKKVSNTVELRVWCDTLVKGYGLPEFVGDAFFNFNLDLWENNIYTVENYIGYFENSPVATSTVFYSDGVAGIYSVSTIESARKKGIGTAITIAPLIDAVELKYQVATLISSELGFGVYESIGFSKFSEMTQFVYDANTSLSQADAKAA